MTSSTRVLAIFAVAAAIFLAPGLAHATPLDEAKAAFAAGKAAFEAGQFQTALAEFQRANRLVPAPNLQFNIGKTYEALGLYREAAAAFERYLEIKGAPDSDDETKFQDELRHRIVADRSRAAAAARPRPPVEGQTQPPEQPPAYQPGYQPYQPTYYPPPQYSYPYQMQPQGWQPTRNELIAEAQGRRRRAVALIVVGLVLDVIGVALAADGFLNPHENDVFGGSAYNWANYTEDVIGISLIITGIPLWASGAASYVRANRRLLELGPADAAPQQPAASIVNLASLRF